MHALLNVPRAGHFYFLEYRRSQDKIKAGTVCERTVLVKAFNE